MDGLHLIAPGLQPFCREYIHQLRLARTHKEKVFWIDWLIHRCHWEGTAQRGQAGAASLIEGRAQDVHAFLSSLSSGTQQTPGVGDPLRYWSPAQMEQSLKWVKQAERRKCKRERTPKINPPSATSKSAPGAGSSAHQG
jgi:predicted Rossmann fold nucleotide-binding protein DprA/Smf involved in DNA uptake